MPRSGGFGYLPAGPAHRRRARRRAPPSPTCCPAAGSTRRSSASRSCASRWRSDPSSATSTATPGPRSSSAADGGYAAESEARAHRRRARARPTTALDLPLGVLSGGERRRVELARILFAGSDVLLPRRAHQPPRRRRQGVAAAASCASYRGALLVISHDLDLLDEAITRVLHLDRPTRTPPAHIVEYKGTYSQYLDGPRRRTRSAWPSWPPRQAKEIARLQTLADRFGAKATQGARWRTALEKRDRPARGRAGRRARERRARCSVQLPDAAARPGRTVLEVDGLAKSLRRPAVFEDVDVRRRPRRAAARAWASTAPARRAAAHPRRRDRAPTSARSSSATTSSLGYYAQEHEGIDAGRDAARPHAREVRRRARPRPSCAACSACSG